MASAMPESDGANLGLGMSAKSEPARQRWRALRSLFLKDFKAGAQEVFSKLLEVPLRLYPLNC
jgi:hypothetical protein